MAGFGKKKQGTTKPATLPKRVAGVVRDVATSVLATQKRGQDFVANTAKKIALPSREKLQAEKEVLQNIQRDPSVGNAILQTQAPGVQVRGPQDVVPFAVQEAVVKPTLRAATSFGLTGLEAITQKPQGVPDVPLSRGLFSGPISDGIAGEKGGEVGSLNTVINKVANKEGFGGSVAKFGEEKLGIDPRFSAPFIGLGLVAADLNPVPGPDDAGKLLKTSKLLNKSGQLVNVVTEAGKVVNGADMLTVLGKARFVDETSTVVQRADGTLRLMTGKRAAQYVAKEAGAEVLGSVADVGKKLGFANAADYASEARKFGATNKVSATDANMRFNAGFDGKQTASATTKPFEPLGITEEVAAREAKIADPYQAAASMGEIRTKEDLLDALATTNKLRALGTPEAIDAATRIMSKVGDSKASTEAAQTLRVMQEFYARQPKSLVNDYKSLLREANRKLEAAGKAPIAENADTVAKIEAIEAQLKATPVGSLQAKALMSEAQNLAKGELPMGLGKWASGWFRSSILSSPATAAINAIGTVAPMPVEALAQGIGRTFGNAVGRGLYGFGDAVSAIQDGNFKGALGAFARGAYNAPNVAGGSVIDAVGETVRGTASAAEQLSKGEVKGAYRALRDGAWNAADAAAGYDVAGSLGAGYDGFKAVLSDLAKGTNSFGEFVDLATGGKNFIATKTIAESVKSGDLIALAKNGGDAMERIARLNTSAADIPVKEAYFFARMDEQARIMKAAGHNIDDPKMLQEIAQRAAVETEFRFFQNNGLMRKAFTGAANGIRNIGKGTEWEGFFNFVADSTIPFTTIPPNLVARGVVDYTPLGFLKNVGILMDAMKQTAKGDLSPMAKLALAREFSQVNSRALAGSTIMGLTAFLGSELGVMTFGRDSRDKIADIQSAQRVPLLGISTSGISRAMEALFTAGLQGDDIASAWEKAKIAAKPQNNDSWMSYEAIQPLAIGVAVTGNMIESAKKSPDKGWAALLPGALDAGAKGVLGNPIFQNFRTAGTASQNPSEAAANLVGNIVTGMVTPALGSWIAQVTDINIEDPTKIGSYLNPRGNVRETYSGNIFEAIGSRIKARIPGLRDDLPQAVDLAGEKVYNKSAFGSALLRSTAPQDISLPPTVQAGINLSDVTGAERAIPTRIDKKGTQFGIDYALSPDELVWARTAYGEATKSELDRLLKDPQFLAKTPVQQESEISTAYSEIHSTIKAYFAMDALGVTDKMPQVPWYSWKAAIDDMRTYKDATGRVVLDSYNSEQKREAILKYMNGAR